MLKRCVELLCPLLNKHIYTNFEVIKEEQWSWVISLEEISVSDFYLACSFKDCFKSSKALIYQFFTTDDL